MTKRKKIKIVKEGYGSAFAGGAGYSYTGGTRGSLTRGGFGGANNLGGPNMMYTYEIKPLNHTLEPRPSNSMDQIEKMHIGSKVTGKPIRANNIQYDKKITGTLQSIQKAEDGSIKYYVVLDEATATLVRIDPTTVKLIVEEPIKYFGDNGTDAPSKRKEKMERAAKNRKVVSESFNEFLKKDKIEEGVGDKFAEKEFNIPQNYGDFEIKHGQQQIKEEGNQEIGTITHSMLSKKPLKVPVKVYKNPKSLKGFGIGARGVITKTGDLYLADSAEVIHYDILDLMEEKNIIPEGTGKGWEDMHKIDFLTIQRVALFNVIAIGESYVFTKVKGSTPEDIEKTSNQRKAEIAQYEHFLEKAKEVNPQFEFVNEQFLNVLRKMVEDKQERKKITLAVRPSQGLDEQYDSPDQKKYNFSKDDFKQLAFADPYEKDKSANLFRHGLYHGKGSVELNNLISQAELYQDHYDAVATMDRLYDLATKAIPILKEFKLDDFYTRDKLHFQKRNSIKDEYVEKDIIVSTDLWIAFQIKGDKDFGRIKNRIRVLFSPSMESSKMLSRDTFDKSKNIPGFTISDEELSQEENIPNTKSLINIPDEEDIYMMKKVRISEENLTLKQFIKLLPKLKANIEEYTNYLHTKYEI